MSEGLDAHIVVERSASFTLDVEVRIAPGHTLALLGPNGAGKSTTVAALAGLLPLDAGRIRIAGRTLDDVDDGTFVPPERRRIGVVFQDYALFPNMSVTENVAFGPRCRGASRRDARRDAIPWIERLELAGLERRRPGQLSGGQAQRVALARALASDPDLLLLDEPLGALDVSTHGRLRRTLAGHLEAFRGPRLLITHDAADAFVLADTIQIIEGGRVTQRGTPAEIRQRPATAYAADLAGVNLLAGESEGGVVTLDGGGRLHVADTHTSGPVLVAIRPQAVALYPERPRGSPRNAWAATVDHVERLGETVRVALGGPIALTADVTPGAATELDLHPGGTTWATVKATEIEVTER